MTEKVFSMGIQSESSVKSNSTKFNCSGTYWEGLRQEGHKLKASLSDFRHPVFKLKLLFLKLGILTLGARLARA